MMEDSLQIRTHFLKNFIRALIINSDPELLAKFNESQKTRKVEIVQIAIPREPAPAKPQIEIRREPIVHEEMVSSLKMPKAVPLAKQEAPPIVVLPSTVKVVPKEEEEVKPPIFERMMNILSDPAVQSVECKGAGAPLVINKGGFIQTTNTRLSEEEIKTLLREFSNRTKIPLLPGVFKVAYQIYVLTAVVSEFVGNRFIIQKRPPQQPLPLPINVPQKTPFPAATAPLRAAPPQIRAPPAMPPAVRR
ncbi:MAG: hypothetical protein MUF61_00405 [archaeon]|jgi:hypothetical protein|nr:hypothetical protein [archaeon]